jgi:hypothetical protein
MGLYDRPIRVNPTLQQQGVNGLVNNAVDQTAQTIPALQPPAATPPAATPPVSLPTPVAGGPVPVHPGMMAKPAPRPMSPFETARNDWRAARPTFSGPINPSDAGSQMQQMQTWAAARPRRNTWPGATGQ